MKYQTGSYSSSENLLQLVKDKLVVEGWVADSHVYVDAADTTFGKRLHLHRGDAYVSLRNFDDYDPARDVKSIGFGKTGIDLRVNTGYSGSEVWYQQPGYSANGRYVQTGASGVYHLFTDAAKVILIAEYETGRYSHVLFGLLNTHVAGTGGQFLAGTQGAKFAEWSVPFDTSTDTTSVRVVKSDFMGWLTNDSYIANQGICPSFSSSNLVRVPNFSPGSTSQIGSIGSSARSSNRLNGLSALMPIYLYVKDSGAWCPYSEFDDVFFVNCDLMTAEQDYVVGDQTFKILPFLGKQIPAVRTGPLYQLGLAVKIDV